MDANGTEIYRREEPCFDYDVLRFGLMYISHPTLFLRRSTFDALGGFRHKLFRNTCDYDLVCRLGRARRKVGHINKILVDARIQAEHGKSAGWFGTLQRIYAKTRRQILKLVLRGKVDLVSGNWKMRRHLLPKASFSSNIGLDKL